MYGLGHVFGFIDPIKTELNWSKPIKSFRVVGLTLNTANIGTPMQVFGLLVLELLKVLLSGTLLFVSPCFHVYNINGSHFVYLF